MIDFEVTEWHRSTHEDTYYCYILAPFKSVSLYDAVFAAHDSTTEQRQTLIECGKKDFAQRLAILFDELGMVFYDQHK